MNQQVRHRHDILKRYRAVRRGGLTRTALGNPEACCPSPPLFAHFRANIMGTSGQAYINALMRLKGGAAVIPAFRADLARVTGRSDIDVWNNVANIGGPIRKVTGV